MPSGNHAEWKFGTVLRHGQDRTIIMVVGFGGDFVADDGYETHDGRAWGVTLWTAVPPGGAKGAWGQPGQTTWIPGHLETEAAWDWEVLEE